MTRNRMFARCISAAILGLALFAPASHVLAGGVSHLHPVFPDGAADATAADDQLVRNYALIFGTVWAPDGRPAHGVKVKIRRANEKKSRWELMSDRRGEFAQRVPAGKAEYVVWADIKVPKGKEKPQVTVKVENDERADISLHLTE